MALKMASQRRKVKGIDAAVSREQTQQQEGSGERIMASDAVEACREIVDEGGGPSEMGTSWGWLCSYLASSEVLIWM